MAWVEPHRGKWKGRYEDTQGRTFNVPVQTSKRTALRMAQEAESKMRTGDWVDPRAGKVSFESYFLEQWLPNRILATRTRATYLSHYQASIRAVFGHVEINQITPRMVQTWVVSMVNAGLKPGTVRAKYAVLASTFDAQRGASAVRDGLVAKSPCAKIDLPKIPKRNPEIYTPEELARLLDHLDGWWRPLVFVCSETGLRWGELMALRPGDIHDGYVLVHRTIIEGKAATMGTGTRFAVKSVPKSGNSRSVALSPEIVDYLALLAEARGLGEQDLFFAMGEWVRDPAWHPPLARPLTVVRTPAWPNGLPVSRSHFRDVWQHAIAAAGVPARRFHDLRATHISWMLAGGADVASVMRRAGHTQIATTQRYTQAMEDADRRALEAYGRTRDGRKHGRKKKKGKKASRNHGLRLAS